MGVTRISFTIRVSGHARSVMVNPPAYPVSIVLRVLPRALEPRQRLTHHEPEMGSVASDGDSSAARCRASSSRRSSFASCFSLRSCSFLRFSNA